MFGLPSGSIYINSVSKENNVMMTDIRSYDEFINELEIVLKYNDSSNIDKLIYKDDSRQYEITYEDYLKIKGVK